jgi:hypothetical protein
MRLQIIANVGANVCMSSAVIIVQLIGKRAEQAVAIGGDFNDFLGAV